MELLARTFAFLTTRCKDVQVEQQVLAKLLEVLSLLCGVVIPDPSSSVVPNDDKLFKVTKFPIKAGWQNVSHELISKRIYNLVIACLVSRFSGWEMDEFHLDLLRSTIKESHFGVNISAVRVRGPLSPDVEAELTDQWNQIAKYLPQSSDFDFQAKLHSAKSSSWYKEVMGDVGESRASYGERDAFDLFRTLSRLCLKAADSTTDSATRNAFLKLALSVVLPLVSTMVDFETPSFRNLSYANRLCSLLVV